MVWITKLKIDGYIFKKEDNDWFCRNHNLTAWDSKILAEIMPKLPNIEKILETTGDKKHDA